MLGTSSSDELPVGSLALALGGFSIDEADLLPAKAPPVAATAGGGRQREVAGGAVALVEHASEIVAHTLASSGDASCDVQADADALASLCFALRSAVGCSGRLGDVDKAALFDLAAQLWSAALGAATAHSTLPRAASALEGMADELYTLALKGEGEGGAPDCARFVAFFSGHAAEWAAVGDRERARRCLERAMRHSQALEAEVAGQAPCERQEEKVVSLFNLYLMGAKSAADGKQQALANNLLSRAVALSRHSAVGPDAALCCAVGIAELQLTQAHAMLSAGGAMGGLASALLSSSYQQLCNSDLAAAAASGSSHTAALLDAKMQVLMMLCRAHLAGKDSLAANKALDTLHALAPGAAATDADSHALFVEARVVGGRVPEALRFLSERLKAADLLVPAGASPAAAQGGADSGQPAGQPGYAAVAAFLAGLRRALCHISEDSMHSFQSAVSTFVWKVTAAAQVAPAALVGLVHALLAQQEQQALCQRLVLQVLAGDDVSAALHGSRGAMAQVHALLWHRAVQLFEGGSPCSAAKELFAAAFQYAQPERRAKNARALAACHSRQGMHQRAAEWLDVAARQEHQPSCLTQLARLQELALTGDAAQAAATIRRLAAPPCLDFHPSLLPAMCQAAAKARQPQVLKEAIGVAAQMLVKKDSGVSIATNLPPGEEAVLLLAQAQSIHACHQSLVQAGSAATTAAGQGATAAADAAMAALFTEFANLVKLATQRVRQLGWPAFAGQQGSKSAATVHALCALAYNQLLAAQQCGAHEHAVALATALVQLLPVVESHPPDWELSGAAGQAKVLLLAEQALLDVHAKQPECAKPLALAAKLQGRVGQAIASLPISGHLPMHLLHQCLCLEAAARRGDGAAMLHALGKLQPHAAHLTARQRRSILAALSGEASSVVREAACSLLLDSMAADGTMEAAALGPVLLTQSVLPPEQQLRVLAVSRRLLAAIPECGRDAVWAGHCQWLATHSWNAGGDRARVADRSDGCSVHAREPSFAARLLAEACALQGMVGPAGEATLERMQAGLAASGLAGAVEAAQHGHCAKPQAVDMQAECSPAEPALESAPACLGAGMPETEPAGTVGVVAAAPATASSGIAAKPGLPDLADINTAPNAPAKRASSHAQPPRSAVPQVAAAPQARLSASVPEIYAAPVPASTLPTDSDNCTAAAGGGSQLMPAEGELSLSDSDAEEPAGVTWLDAVFAAQKRALGSAMGLRHAKRQAVQAQAAPVGGQIGLSTVPGMLGVAQHMPAGLPAVQMQSQEEQQQQQQQQLNPAPMTEEDGADALSLCST